MSMTRNPFLILGVSPADDMTTIRMAWRAKVRLLHPDRAHDKKKATADLAEVNAAFDMLRGHVPTAQVKAGKVRQDAELQERARRAAKHRAEARRRAEERAEAARRHREALERGAAKAHAAKTRLEAEMGTINARAAQGYEAARRVVSTLQK